MAMLGSIGALLAPRRVVANVQPVELEPVQPTSQKIAILAFEATPDLESFAQNITTALRGQYPTASYPLTEPKDLVEMKLVFCEGEERPDCMARAGKSLKADQLIYGYVKPDGRGGCIVTVKRLDVESGVVEQAFDIVRPEDANAAARLIYARLTETAAVAPPHEDPPPAASPPSTYVEAPAAEVTPLPSPPPYRELMWASLGTMVATAAVGGFFLYRGEQEERAANKLIDESTTTDPSGGRHFTNRESERAYQSRIAAEESAAERDSTIGVVGVGIGVAAGITAGAFYFFGRRKIRPHIGVQDGGMSVGLMIYSR